MIFIKVTYNNSSNALKEEKISDTEMLNYFLKDSKMSKDDIHSYIINMNRRRILNEHPYTIWQGKDGKWRTYVNDDTNKQGRKLIKKTKKLALEEAIIYFKQQEKELITFEARFEIWKKRQIMYGVCDNTLYKYNADYARFFRDSIIEDVDINKIDDDLLMEFFVDKVKERELSKRAFDSLFSIVNNVFIKSMRDKLIATNPCEYIDTKMIKKRHCVNPKPKTATERTVSDVEMHLLYNAFKADHENKPDYIPTYAVEFATLTGMRVGELAALKWSNINVGEGYILIDSSERYNRLTKEYSVDDTKTGKERKIPITEQMAKLLEDVKKVEIQYGYVCEYVFSNKKGRIHASVISNCAINKCIQAGIDKKSIHSMRRTLNSKLRCAGVSSAVASSLLGHTEKVNNENYTYDTSGMEYKTEVFKKVNNEIIS